MWGTKDLATPNEQVIPKTGPLHTVIIFGRKQALKYPEETQNKSNTGNTKLWKPFGYGLHINEIR